MQAGRGSAPGAKALRARGRGAGDIRQQLGIVCDVALLAKMPGLRLACAGKLALRGVHLFQKYICIVDDKRARPASRLGSPAVASGT